MLWEGDEVSMMTWLPENEEGTMPITGVQCYQVHFSPAVIVKSPIATHDPLIPPRPTFPEMASATPHYWRVNQIFNKHNDVHDDRGA